MGKKATKKSTAAETTDAHDNEHQDDTTVFPPSPAPTSSSHDDAELDEEKAGQQIEPSKRQAKEKKAPVANMTEKPSTATPAKGSDCGIKEANAKDAKKGQKKSGPPSDSTSIPVPAPTVRPASAREVSAFTSPIFTIYVGLFKQSFAAHQAIISQSPVLEKKCTTQLTKKGRAKTSFFLQHERPLNFAALLQYLYSGQVYLNIPLSPDGSVLVDEAASEQVVVRTAKKLARLYAIGADYELEELQAQVTKVLKMTKLIEKLPGMEFFELAEKLYPDDPDTEETDGFAQFFAEYAPSKVRTVPVNRTGDLLRMVSNGGAFAQAIFLAYNVAVRTATIGEAGFKIEQGVGVESAKEAPKNKRARDEGNDSENRDANVGEEMHVDKRSKNEVIVSKEGAVPGQSAASDENAVPKESALSKEIEV